MEGAITPQNKDGFIPPKNSLATAVAVAIEEPTATLKKAPSSGEQASETSMADQDGNLQKGELPKKGYALTVKADGFSLDVDCNYEIHRIEIRNSKTRDTVVVRMRNNVPSIKSADFDVSPDEHGVYHLNDWPVTVAVPDADGVEPMIDVQVLDGGPWIRLKF